MVGQEGSGKTTILTQLFARASRGQLEGDLRGMPVASVDAYSGGLVGTHTASARGRRRRPRSASTLSRSTGWRAAFQSRVTWRL